MKERGSFAFVQLSTSGTSDQDIIVNEESMPKVFRLEPGIN